MDLSKMSREELETLKVEIDRVLESRPDEGANWDVLVDFYDIREMRLATLRHAHSLGATMETLVTLRDARRVSQSDTITIPRNRLEGLSRGRGWARKGRGDSVEWGERTENGMYEVGPGEWTVGGSDGFRRKDSDTWIVEHVQVGDQTWTIAN